MPLNKNSKNSLWLSSQYTVMLVLSLIGLKLNLLTLGSQVFSIWVLLFSIWGVGSAVDFGFGISTVKFVAQYKSDYAKVNKIISTCFFLFFVLGVVIAVMGCFVAELVYIGNPKIVPHNLITQARTICLLSGAIFYVQYLTIVFRSILEGHEDFVRTSKIAIANSLLIFVCVIVVYCFHLTAALLAVFYLVAAVVQLFVFLFFFRAFYKHLSIGFVHVNVATFKEIWKFSISVQATFFLGSLIDPITKYLLGTYSENKLIPPYEIAKRFTLAVSGLFSFAFKNTLPNVSKLSGKQEQVTFLFLDGVGVSRNGISFSGLFFGVFPIVFTLIFTFFYGYKESAVIFMILGLAESVNNAGYILYVFILGIGKSSFLGVLQAVNIIVISAVLIIGLLIFRNSLALFGYYVSVLGVNLAMLLYIRKQVGISVLSFYRKTGFWKIFCLNIVMLASIFVYFVKPDALIASQMLTAAFCVWLFWKDILGIFAFSRNVLKNSVAG